MLIRRIEVRGRQRFRMISRTPSNAGDWHSAACWLSAMLRLASLRPLAGDAALVPGGLVGADAFQVLVGPALQGALRKLALAAVCPGVPARLLFHDGS